MGDHGFLTRRVLARYSRLLEPIMEPGEELIGFEIFPLSALGPRFPSHNERLEAFLSNLALYLVTPLQPNRIPLTEIRKVIVEGRLVAVRLFSGQTLNLGAPLGKPRALIGRLQAS